MDQIILAPFGGFPLAAGTYSDFMLMKFAPTAAYQVNDWLSVGAALNVDYSTLDLRQGNGANYGDRGAVWDYCEAARQNISGLDLHYPAAR